MVYKPSEIRTLSMLGQRGVFGFALNNLSAKNDKIIALSADLRNTSGLDRFADNYPDRFINVGIAEQNMIGVAAGLADSGYIVFASTFANFAALRACEFVRHFMGYMCSSINLVGLAAGFAMEYFGNTHYGIEDLSSLRAISNLTIVTPADGLETLKAVTALVDYDSPTYLRLTGTTNTPVVYKNDFTFEIGKANLIKNGTEIALIACGGMVAHAVEASKILETEGISCAVVDMHTIKPLDMDMLNELSSVRIIATIEEHSVIGGLGSAVAEFLSEKDNAPKLLRFGIMQKYKDAGSYRYMIEQHGLSPSQIADRVVYAINQQHYY